MVRKVLVGPELFLTGGKLFRSDSQLVYFSYGTFVRSADKASSLDEAERKSILAATAKLQRSVQSIVAGLRESLNLGLGDDFRLEKYHSKGITPSIIDVQSQGSQWHLTVQGVWKEIVTLDSNFRLISHVPAPGEKAKYWMNP